MNRTCLIVFLLCSGCFSATPDELGHVVHRQLLCVEEYSCKAALAEDCKRGGTIHNVTSAVVIEYSCNP